MAKDTGTFFNDTQLCIFEKQLTWRKDKDWALKLTTVRDGALHIKLVKWVLIN